MASHRYNDTQLRYSQVEREMLAPIWGCDRFSRKLICKKFTIKSDNKAVCEIIDPSNNKPSKSTRINTWMSGLTRFNYDVTHIKGKMNCADYISRCMNANTENKELSSTKRFTN